MSRLDSAIRRLAAQRDCLDRSVALVSGMAGPVLELGLGNGRTYSHLLERCADREIWVFERQLNPHPDCMPPADRLIMGDLRDTLPTAAALIGSPAALAHMDIGTGDPEASRALAAALAPLLVPLLASGAVLVHDQPFDHPALVPLDLPDGVAPGRYFLARRR
jgi:hypothetical protein